MYRPGQNPTKQGEKDDWEINNAAALPFPIEGRIKSTGESVTYLQTCDVPGHSPSLVGVDANGEFFIASFAESKATDQRVVPNEKLSMLRGQTRERQTASAQA